MLGLGIIRPSTSSYFSLMLLVRKKDENWRFCVDYQALNNVSIHDKFLKPVIEKLNGANVFTKIDIKSKYHQIQMWKK